jgi:predicted metal-dependent hydrolase
MNKEQLRRGVDQFNNGFYFEAHDTLEDLWRETSGINKPFLQGLIQVSVGLYHFFNDNYKGAVSQLSKGMNKLSGYRPAHCEIEVENFLQVVAGWHGVAERRLNGEPSAIQETNVPKIYYQSDISII